MGVYIKDYDIPSGECEHLILDFTTMKAMAVFGNRKQYDIVSVKTPHGRLIDADAEYKALSEMKVEGEVFVTAVEFAKIEMEQVQTVIEAEVE